MNTRFLTMRYFLLATNHLILEDSFGTLYSIVADPQDFTFGFYDEFDESKLKALSSKDNAAIARLQEAEKLHAAPLQVYSIFKNNIIFGHAYQPKLFISVPASLFEQLTDTDIAEIGDMPGNTDLSNPLTAEVINNRFIIY